MSNGAGTATLAVFNDDALGRRVLEWYPTLSPLNVFVYFSPQGQVLEERWGTTAIPTTPYYQYVWGLGYVNELVLRDEFNADGSLKQRLYAQQDANWNVTTVVNTQGVVVERYEYDPYGNVTVLNAAGTTPIGASTVTWRYLFQGGRQDRATGWYIFQNRDYIPSEGRWAQKDLLGLGAGDTNIYNFVANNPVGSVDWSGLIGESQSGGASGYTQLDGGIFDQLNNFFGPANDALDTVDRNLRPINDAVLGRFRSAGKGLGGRRGDALDTGLNSADSIAAGIANPVTAGLSSRLRDGLYGEIATDNESGALYNASWNAGAALAAVTAFANPCAIGRVISAGLRGLIGAPSVGNALNDYDGYNRGDCLGAGLSTLGAIAGAFQAFAPCFAAGTPLRTPDGDKPIEQFYERPLIVFQPI